MHHNAMSPTADEGERRWHIEDEKAVEVALPLPAAGLPRYRRFFRYTIRYTDDL